MNLKYSLYFTILIVLGIISQTKVNAQCSNQVLHTSGTETINGIDVTVTSWGEVMADLTYCPEFSNSYIIGRGPTLFSDDGSYTFQFSPAIESLTLDFAGISNGITNHIEIVVLYINGVHYQVEYVGVNNGCDDFAVLTPYGNITACPGCGGAGWNGTNIPGPITSLTVLDSVTIGAPNGSLFSLFICDEFVTSVNESNNIDSSINIYPNPIFDILKIERQGSEQILIRIYDNSGKLIISKISSEHITSFDLIDYSPGIYFLSINDGKNTTTQKVVKL